MKNILTKAGITFGLAASLAVAATTVFAQQQTPAQGGPEAGGMSGRMGRHGRNHKGGGDKHKGGMGFLRKLNLTDAQREQFRAIEERYAQSTKEQRGELRQLSQERGQGELSTEQEARARALRQQLGDSARQMRAESIALLTPEQRAEAERIMQEHKARRESRRERREEKQINLP